MSEEIKRKQTMEELNTTVKHVHDEVLKHAKELQEDKKRIVLKNWEIYRILKDTRPLLEEETPFSEAVDNFLKNPTVKRDSCITNNISHPADFCNVELGRKVVEEAIKDMKRVDQLKAYERIGPG